MQRLNWSHEYNFDKGLERKGNLSVLQQKIISIKSFKNTFLIRESNAYLSQLRLAI